MLTQEEINSCLEALSEMDKDEGVKEVDEMSDCQLYLMEKLAEYSKRCNLDPDDLGMDGVYDFMSFVTGKSVYRLIDEVEEIKKGEN